MNGGSRSKAALLAYTRKLELALVAYLCKRQEEMNAAGETGTAALVLTEAELQTARGRLTWMLGYTPDGQACTLVTLQQPAVVPAVDSATREALLDVVEGLAGAREGNAR